MRQQSDRWRYSMFTGFLAGALVIIATWFTRDHMMETEAAGAIGLWLLSGFVAAIIGLKMGEAIWPHSLLRSSVVLALALITMIALGSRSPGGVALSAVIYGPALLGSLLITRHEWKKRRRADERRGKG